MLIVRGLGVFILGDYFFDFWVPILLMIETLHHLVCRYLYTSTRIGVLYQVILDFYHEQYHVTYR